MKNSIGLDYGYQSFGGDKSRVRVNEAQQVW